MESPLSCVLAVAPETPPLILPTGTAPAGCRMAKGSMKICKNDLNEMNHERDLMVQMGSSGYYTLTGPNRNG